MKGKSLGKMGLECGKKMGLWCGKEVKERNISQNFKQHTYIYIYILVNVVADMEAGEGNLGTKK